MELTTSEAKALIDEIAAMQIFYINIGGGEPMMRDDFFELIAYAVNQHVGVKFSTNGTRIDEAAAKRLAGIDYLDIQISIDGVDATTSDRIRGAGSYERARRAMDNLKAANFGQFKISVVMTKESVEQLEEFEALARHYGAELRLARLRPSGRGADVWEELHPTLEQNRRLYRWLLERPISVARDASSVSSIRWARSTPVRSSSTTSSRLATFATPASRQCGHTANCSGRCENRGALARVTRVAPTTPVAAAAWRRNSSPGSK